MATPPAYPPYDPTPFRDLLSVFTTAIDKLDTHTTARLNRMETAMTNATKIAAEALQVATSARQETKDGLERLHTGVVNAAKCSLASSERIEMILGNVNGDPDVDPEHESVTVLGRIRQLERAVVELSESVSDPDAARPTVVRHETAVNTDPVERVLVDVGISAIELDPSVRHADVSTQVAVPAEKAPQVSPLPEPFARTTAGSQLNRGRAGTRFEVQAASAPSATQALVPAHWSSGGGCSDGPSSSDTSKLPSPAPIPRLNIGNAPVNIPAVSSEGRASSVLDEQEILQSLSADVDGASRTTPSSPPPAPALQAPPTPPLPRAVGPIPRSSTFAPSGATPRPSSSASPPTNPPTTSTTQSPPIPRRTAVAALAAAAASSMASSMAMTNMAVAASMMSSPPLPAPRAVVPIPRGYGKKSATSGAATSSPSGASQPTPTRPPVTPSSSSGSLSSLSSLSSPPKSQTGTQPRPTSVAGRAQASPAASSSVAPGSSASARVGASTSRAGSARGRSKSTARGGKVGASTSASARVTVKKERSEKKPPGPPAKRRKTAGGSRPALDDSDSDSSSDDDHEVFPVSASSRGGKGASKGARGGGRGRGPGRGGKAGGAAGGRKSAGGGTPSASGGGSKVSGKGSSTAAKAKNDPKAIGTDCRWPAKIEGDEAYQREFVQCDNCEAWYHFGCVGLKTGDPRLEPDAEFVCPPCESSDTIHKQRQGLRFQEAACMRPDCARAGRAEDTHEYFVERIIGRRPYDADVGAGVARPERFLWLVKWDGWKAESASWQERAHLGDCARFIEEFEQAAEIEGRDISKLDQVIVLNEGLAAGW